MSVLSQSVRRADRHLFGRAGWARILRNTAVGFFKQAGTRMAAALSYYTLLAAGPMLVLTIALGALVLGEQPTRDITAVAISRLLPPSASSATSLAEQAVRASSPSTGLALVTGLVSLIGFTRALTTSLNVMLNESGVEPIQRTVAIVPLLYLAVVGLLWGSWLFELLGKFAEASAADTPLPNPGLVVGRIAPLLLALTHFTILLAVVPRARLSLVEIVVPALLGAVLWEAARNLFGWLVGTDSYYLHVFGPLGGVVALLGWIYASSVILVLTGQFAWAFAMERRGRGDLARRSPRQAGLAGWADLEDQDNAVNE
ncbi:MAG: YihY/virulence factor BrkB family protein [Chloroflexota bacterium]